MTVLLLILVSLLPVYPTSLSTHQYSSPSFSTRQHSGLQHPLRHSQLKLPPRYKEKKRRELSESLNSEKDSAFHFKGGKISISKHQGFVVVGEAGKTAYVPCTVYNLANHTVSWIRRSDGHILTVGTEVFISDSRFSVTRSKSMLSDTFTLQIKQAKVVDALEYECQVSVNKLFQRFKLKMMVPKVVIAGGPVIYARSGERLELSCLVSRTVHPPTHVFWYINNQMIIPVSNQRLLVSSASEARSILTLQNVSLQDSGEYRCCPALLESANVNLQVLEQEESPSELVVNSSPLHHLTALAVTINIVIYLLP